MIAPDACSTRKTASTTTEIAPLVIAMTARLPGGWQPGWGRVRGLAAISVCSHRRPGGRFMSVLDDIVAGVREDLLRRQSEVPEQ